MFFIGSGQSWCRPETRTVVLGAFQASFLLSFALGGPLSKFSLERSFKNDLIWMNKRNTNSVFFEGNRTSSGESYLDKNSLKLFTFHRKRTFTVYFEYCWFFIIEIFEFMLKVSCLIYDYLCLIYCGNNFFIKRNYVSTVEHRGVHMPRGQVENVAKEWTDSHYYNCQ